MSLNHVVTYKEGHICRGIDPQDRAFLYGDGLFTSVRVEGGQPLLWSRHLARLYHGAERLGLSVNFPALIQDALLHASQLGSGVLKVIISRGIGQRGYLPPEQPALTYLQVFPQEFSSGANSAIESGILTGQLGQTIPQLAGLKTLNRLEQVILRAELAQHGWIEGLVCDAQGFVVEGVYSNCFFHVDGQWWTPEIVLSGIAGVMRAEIMAQMQAQDIPLHIQTLHRDAVDRIQALFFCNALTGIVPVRTFAGRVLDVAAVQSLLNLLF